ncbi:MAG: hypothetical protein ABI846_06975 [Rudaea sp.]
MRALPVLLSFGRSGGTLVNQMLGVHPDCLVLSEVNPAASFKPIVEQALEWLRLIDAEHAEAFGLLPYDQQIRKLAHLAAARDKTLVLRDWTTVNFVAGTSVYARPSRRLEQCIYLKLAGLSPVPLAVVRRSEAVYVSWRENFAQFAELDAAYFIEAYLDYAAAVREYPIVRLEQLRADPQAELRRIFEAFGLSAAPLDFVLANFHRFTNCTGNNTLGDGAKSVSAREVLPPPPRASAGLSEDVVTRFALADKWLGYD